MSLTRETSRHRTMQGGRTSRSRERTTRDGWIVVYCDGAGKNNGKPDCVAGVGVWWGDGDPRCAFSLFIFFSIRDADVDIGDWVDRNIAERCPGAQTNNRAELIVRSSLFAHSVDRTRRCRL